MVYDLRDVWLCRSTCPGPQGAPGGPAASSPLPGDPPPGPRRTESTPPSRKSTSRRLVHTSAQDLVRQKESRKVLFVNLEMFFENLIL
jgi:hypothetical protein